MIMRISYKGEHDYYVLENDSTSAKFDSLSDLMEFAEAQNIEVADDEFTLAYRLGGMAVQLSECGLDAEKIVEAMDGSTDHAYDAAAIKLAKLLLRFAGVPVTELAACIEVGVEGADHLSDETHAAIMAVAEEFER